jgi:hypothetical protein
VSPVSSRNKRHVIRILYIATFMMASLFVVHTSLVNTTTHIDLYKWIAGQEKLPFQRRLLLIPLVRATAHLSIFQHFSTTRHYLLFDPVNIALVVVDFLSMLGCGALVTLLYDRTTHNGSLRWAPSALLLMLYVFTCGFRYEARFIFPYDMLSMFFFTLGLYFIHSNRLWALLLLMPVATLNRETTLMWAPLLLMAGRYRARISSNPRSVWIKTALTTAAVIVLWLGITHWTKSLYPRNDASEDYPRILENLALLVSFREWDQLFSLFAFTLPFLLIFRRDIDDGVLRNFIPIIPLWVALMFYQGVFVEGRIFGELLPYAAVISVLIFEHIYQPHCQALYEETHQTLAVTAGSSR